MSLFAPPLNAYLFQAQVLAVNPEYRTIDVRWMEVDVVKRACAVVQDSSNYSFPKIGEIGLVIGSDQFRYYYLGKMEFNYKNRFDATSPDTLTGKREPLRAVEDGEIQLLNHATTIELFFPKDGGFDLGGLNGDGLHYVADRALEPFRWLTAVGKIIHATTTTSFLKLGAVIRFIPVLGDKIVLDAKNKTVAAQEILAKVTSFIGAAPTQIDKAKLHLGDIFEEPILSPQAAIPMMHTEVGAPGLAAMLRAILAAYSATGAEVSSVKLDDLGNLSINATTSGTGNIVVNASTKISIGGDAVATTEPAVHGRELITWLNGHTHSTSMGPSGPPTVIAVPTDFCSTKVFVK